MFEKYALPTAPKPRGASISPPVQHRVAKIDVKIDNKPSTFSFIKYLQYIFNSHHKKYYS